MTQIKQFSTQTQIFFNSDVENPDEFFDSESSPTNFSQPLFQSKTTPTPVELSLSHSSLTDTSPTLSPLSSNEPDVTSLITDDQLEHNLDELFTHLQQIHNTNISLLIHQLSH